MNLRWLVFDYVDPDLPLSKVERRQVRRRGMNKGGDVSTWHGQRGLMILSAMIPATCMLLTLALFFIVLEPTLLGIAITLLVQIILTWLLLAFLGRYTWRPLVCVELRRMGHEVCTHCGYWLRGLTDDVKQCPECGTKREAMPS